MSEILLSATAVTKRFGAVTAVDEVDLELRAGEVHAVVGENGAGKSTLARILAGVLAPDAGAVRGAPRGEIAMVPQALSLVGALSLAEHVALAQGPGRFDAAAAGAALAASAARLGARLPVDVPTAELSLPERQLGELAVALALGARVLLLDEPTSSLGPEEVDRLVASLRGLAEDGVAVLLVTHRIREALRSSDRLTVLRGGRLVHHGPVAGLDADDVARHMVGELVEQTRPVARPRGDVRLVVEALTTGAGPGELTGVSLTAAAGEVVGVAGIAGSGQRALAEAIAGLRAPAGGGRSGAGRGAVDRWSMRPAIDRGPVERAASGSGRVLVDGVDVTGDAARAAAQGVAFIPETRGDGLAADHSGAVNASLLHTLRDRRFRTRLGLRRRAAEDALADDLYRRFDVRPPLPQLPARALSGGNQQKLLVARELERGPAVVVAHGATQGLDLRAAAAIRGALLDAAAAGAAVVVLSADLDEVLALADRVVVLSGGRVTDELAAGERADAARIGHAMAGTTPVGTEVAA
ncbi:ATP-binding cassette domain-containing protein [Conexibacter woesei]|uniref:ABC transporter related protein n=1 Tax=Conexibacter woesei (strain DSM 14684 / CCUG 47730 / CIP 108061 / JCM 11494 / NBRC 100937 / ID131577) TaxID=469383 RepID=D3F9N8_CONWI|nr:ATP-binding cassette domain-containing protein [Conexibacter woesei]ADB51100.1 ABC transporter related protein [Conexibacter woesei DSM 14684]